LPGGAGSDQTYEYNSAGNLISETTGSSQTTYYLYDLLRNSANSGPVLELDDTGSSGPSAVNLKSPSGEQLLRYYQSSGSLSSLGMSTPMAYHQDPFGSPLATVNTSTGAATSESTFSAFGKPIESSGNAPGSNQQPFGYLHRPLLGSTGLVNMNARAYDPELGRFLSQDPISGSPAQPQSLNPYAYGLANPFSTPDITGLSVNIFGAEVPTRVMLMESWMMVSVLLIAQYKALKMCI